MESYDRLQSAAQR